jgi:phosphoglucomutase
MLDRLREDPPRSIGGLQVLEVADRLTKQVRDLRNNATRPFTPIADPRTGQVIEQLTLASDNLLTFALAGNDVVDGGFVAIRPSGTEPKCKFYISAHAAVGENASDADLDAVKVRVDNASLAMKDDVVRYSLALVERG